jgi:hypothetical protein
MTLSTLPLARSSSTILATKLLTLLVSDMQLVSRLC